MMCSKGVELIVQQGAQRESSATVVQVEEPRAKETEEEEKEKKAPQRIN